MPLDSLLAVTVAFAVVPSGIRAGAMDLVMLVATLRGVIVWGAVAVLVTGGWLGTVTVPEAALVTVRPPTRLVPVLRSLTRWATVNGTFAAEPAAVIVAPVVDEKVNRRPATAALVTPPGSEGVAAGGPVTQLYEFVAGLKTYASTCTWSAPAGSAKPGAKPVKSAMTNGLSALSVV